MAASWIHQIELSKLVFKAGFSGVAPKIASYRIGYVSNTLRSNFDRILIEIESKSNRIAKRMYSGKVICACFFERVPPKLCAGKEPGVREQQKRVLTLPLFLSLSDPGRRSYHVYRVWGFNLSGLLFDDLRVRLNAASVQLNRMRTWLKLRWRPPKIQQTRRAKTIN
jgi:hypothetical protein